MTYLMRIIGKVLGFSTLCVLMVLSACTRREKHTIETCVQDTLSVDTFSVDSVIVFEDEEEDYRHDSLYVENFDDFLYSFGHDDRFRSRRTSFPFVYIDNMGDTTTASRSEWKDDLSFLQQDFYTVLYNNALQIESSKELSSDTVVVERIDLDSLQLSSYHFARRKGTWRLFKRQDFYVQGSELSDFLVFYRQFSRDSIFQQASISQPLHFSMEDPEGGMDAIEGTIDATQWFSFCSDVPTGIISNIRYGQVYNQPHSMVMQKCAAGSGFMEIFSFDKSAGHWRLVSYEN